MSPPLPLAQLFSLTGRTAVVTGAAQGLGRAIAERLAEAGANLLLLDLEAEKIAQVATEIAQRHGHRAAGLAADVSDRDSVLAAAEHAQELYRRIDIWVNNAGLFPNLPAQEFPESLWDQVFAVNNKAILLSAQAAAPYLAANATGGVIVNIISTAGFKVAFPGMSAYVSSKHAARGLTKSLAVDLAPQGIRVLGVAPSFVPTEGNIAAAAAAAAQAGLSPEDLPTPDVMNQSLIGRAGVPDDIARVVLFAASPAATIMTGSTLLADAGEAL